VCVFLRSGTEMEFKNGLPAFRSNAVANAQCLRDKTA